MDLSTACLFPPIHIFPRLPNRYMWAPSSLDIDPSFAKASTLQLVGHQITGQDAWLKLCIKIEVFLKWGPPEPSSAPLVLDCQAASLFRFSRFSPSSLPCNGMSRTYQHRSLNHKKRRRTFTYRTCIFCQLLITTSVDWNLPIKPSLTVVKACFYCVFSWKVKSFLMSYVYWLKKKEGKYTSKFGSFH